MKYMKKNDNRLKTAIDNGYQLLVVWESEYKEDPEKVIEQCKNYLNQ